MRKLLALLLVCVLAVGLVGCGRTGTPEKDTAVDPLTTPEGQRPSPTTMPSTMPPAQGQQQPAPGKAP